ncbi:MAG: ACP S-malonyltransferase [Burkholderiales bacterium]|nr:ACP S-malonyltransferase [Burkholderiales bacterium]
MKTKTVCMFPGQGSQFGGMGEALFERYPDLAAQADACLGYSLRELCVRDPDHVLSHTQYTQPALYVVGALAYLDWRAQGHPAPDYVAGHSLGEYCALFAAGAFDFITGLKLVSRRGELMSRAPKGAMAAILNIDPPSVERVLASLPFRNIDLANINSRKQCIISGLYEEIHAPQLQQAFAEAGASVLPLNVSAAFHSRCMKDVEGEFGRFLSQFNFGELKIPVVANYTARPYPSTGYLDLLRLQISHSVRWYESASWLLAQGCTHFQELGAGEVLARLQVKIAADPLVLPLDEAPAAAAPSTAPRPGANPDLQPGMRPAPRRRARLVFMYAGQGSQYYRMGQQLYDTHEVFRGAMDRCAQEYRELTGQSLLDLLYHGPGKGTPFVELQGSHGALFSIGHSLTETLRAEGFEPDAVLGHSLGEYVACAVAGALDWRQALRLVLRQSTLFGPLVGQGGLLSVLAEPRLFEQRPALFGDLALAGVNYQGNFLLSGRHAALELAQARLEDEGIVCIRLPVPAAFHSPELDPFEQAFVSAVREMPIHRPRLPMYSAATAAVLGSEWLEDHAAHFWRVVREPIRFDRLIDCAFEEAGDVYFVDLSASGSFANFMKYGFPGRQPCRSAINQFGNDKASLSALLADLRALG